MKNIHPCSTQLSLKCGKVNERGVPLLNTTKNIITKITRISGLNIILHFHFYIKKNSSGKINLK